MSLIAALVNSPKLLVLDEPTTGVDQSSRRAVHAEILRCVEKGGSVFFASHSMDEVGDLSTHLAILGLCRKKFLFLFAFACI